MTASDDDLLFIDEQDGGAHSAGTGIARWKMLIVDDEPEVHSITRLVLADFLYKGRPAEFLSAYSAAEAREVLDREKDIAIILLDVVMETDDAGLNLVRYIRGTLKNRHVRIILRTGQPGQAPERAVILDYDINDYKAKTQLTAQQLFTTTVAALRSYEDIVALDTNRVGLEKIIEASSSLFQARSMKLFAVGVLTQLSAIVGVGPNAILFVQRNPTIDGEDGIHVLAGSGRFEELIEEEARIEEPVRRSVVACLESKRNSYESDHCTLYIRSPNNRENVVYLQADRHLSDLDRSLIELFCSKISVGFDNLAMYEQVRQAQDSILAVLAETAEVWEAVSTDLNLRIAKVTERVARGLRVSGTYPGQMDEPMLEMLGMAAILHDVGNTRVSPEILTKAGPLDEAERRAMQDHTLKGADILSRVLPLKVGGYLHLGVTIARSHHEAWDGRGYPEGLSGEAIPLPARIVAVADAYDALTRPRPWRGPYSHDEALTIIRADSGRRYDPAVVDALMSVASQLPDL